MIMSCDTCGRRHEEDHPEGFCTMFKVPPMVRTCRQWKEGEAMPPELEQCGNCGDYLADVAECRLTGETKQPADDCGSWSPSKRRTKAPPPPKPEPKPPVPGKGASAHRAMAPEQELSRMVPRRPPAPEPKPERRPEQTPDGVPTLESVLDMVEPGGCVSAWKGEGTTVYHQESAAEALGIERTERVRVVKLDDGRWFLLDHEVDFIDPDVAIVEAKRTALAKLTPHERRLWGLPDDV